MNYLVTGGAGFIGSHFVDLLFETDPNATVVVLDLLTYAGHEINLEQHHEKSQFHFVQGDICDEKLTLELLKKYSINRLVNFAAESHVDRSISNPTQFVETNVMGVASLLMAAQSYLEGSPQTDFRFLQVSTDEVYGALGDEGFFVEDTPLAPTSPYSSAKAAGDLLALAWNKTYKFPVMVTRCSNNYGPRQFPEKLIPLMISNAVEGKKLPVYGTGKNVRDWIHVTDHCKGLLAALEKGELGGTYIFGGHAERNNLDVVHTICDSLDEIKPKTDGTSYRDQVAFVEDRKGHDFRYAIDSTVTESRLNFKPQFDFEKGLKETILWYLDNNKWKEAVLEDQQ